VTKKKTTKTKTPPPAKLEGVELYFAKYAATHQNPVNKIIQVIFIPLLLFSIFAIVWCIQFPYIKFLGRYNADFNWSSVLLAVAFYYYYRFSPALSYVFLLLLLIIFYAITELAMWQSMGGPALWETGDILFIVSCVMLFIGYIKEGKRLSFEYRYKNILIAPLYLVQLIFKKFSIKY